MLLGIILIFNRRHVVYKRNWISSSSLFYPRIKLTNLLHFNPLLVEYIKCYCRKMIILSTRSSRSQWENFEVVTDHKYAIFLPLSNINCHITEIIVRFLEN